MAELGLNDRQKQAIIYLKTHGRISNTEYQQVAHSIKKTATRDLNDLKNKGIIQQIGSRGAGVHYVLAGKGDTRVATHHRSSWTICGLGMPHLGMAWLSTEMELLITKYDTTL